MWMRGYYSFENATNAPCFSFFPSTGGGVRLFNHTGSLFVINAVSITQGPPPQDRSFSYLLRSSLSLEE
jgi:hypothetical protein